MDKITPCPFCGEDFKIVETTMGFFTATHISDCPMWNEAKNCQGYSDRQVLIEALNTRPIEKALYVRIDDLEKVVRWYADPKNYVNGVPGKPWDKYRGKGDDWLPDNGETAQTIIGKLNGNL